MKDIHSHLLYNIDDGSSSLELTLSLLEKASNLGFTHMCLTPHFKIFENLNYNANNDEKLKILNEIKSNFKKIDLSYGNEVFIDENILKNLKNGNISTINNSRYLLVEFPFDFYFEIFDLIIDDLICHGYIIILAHPERYKFFQYDISRVKYFKNKGVLLQCNYGSIIDCYGSASKKTFKLLLKNNFVDLFSLDLHSNPIILDKFLIAKKKILKIISKEKFDYMSNHIISKILENEI